MTMRTTTALAALALCAVVAAPLAAQEQAAPAGAAQVYEGKVQTALGPYLYLPSAKGFDIVLQGFDAAALVGKDIRVKGELLADKGNVFRGDSVEEKQGGAYASVYTRSADLALADYVSSEARDAYAALAIDNANKPEQWEGKGQAKVYGQLVTEPAAAIVLRDAANKEIGRVLVDNVSEYARYYVQKLRLFDRLWFYLNVKESVDKKDRAKSRNLFHADVVFAGLF